MKLKTDILITLFSNLVLAFSQWVLIASLNHSGNISAVGQYSYALALAGVTLTLGQMGLRQFLMSKSAASEHLDQIFATRLITSAISWVMLFIYTYLVVDDKYFNLVLILGLAKVAENLSDIAHGFYQRNFKIKYVARSRIGRSILTPSIFLGVFFLFDSLLLASASIIFTWVTVFFVFDKSAFTSRQLRINKLDQLPEILLQAYPMGIASVLVILTVSIPLFTLANMSSDAQVGQYASIFYFVTAGSMVLQSALQVLSPIIVSYTKDEKYCEVKRITNLCYLLGLGFGCIGIAAAVFFGEWVIVLLYGASFTGLGNLVVAASYINFAIAIQSASGIVLTAHGIFKYQMLIMLLSVVVSAVSSYFFISGYGVRGALFAGAVTSAFTAICFSIRVRIELRNNG